MPRAASPPSTVPGRLEVERHRAQGTSAAFLGAEAVAWDRFARRARLDDTARRCFARLTTGSGDRRLGAGVRRRRQRGAGRRRRGAPEFAARPGWRRALAALDPARRLARHAHPVRRLPHQALARGGRPPARATDAVGLFATDGPGTSGSNGWLVTGERTATGRADHRGRPAPVHRGPRRLPADPARLPRVRRGRASPSPASPASRTSATPARSPGPSPTPWPTTRTCTGNGCARTPGRRGARRSVPDGWETAASGTSRRSRWRAPPPVEVEVVETGARAGDHRRRDRDSGEGAAGSSLASATRPASPATSASTPCSRCSAPARSPTSTRRWTAGSSPSTWSWPPTPRAATLHRVAGRVPLRAADNRLRTVPAWEPRTPGRPPAPMPRADVRRHRR